MARALIVGCGCRARELGRAALGRGLAGARNDPRRGAGGGDRARGHRGRPSPTPIASARCSTRSATSRWSAGCSGRRRAIPSCSPRCTARGSSACCEELVDTPVRGLVYEAAGSVTPERLREGRAGGRRRLGALAHPGRGCSTMIPPTRGDGRWRPKPRSGGSSGSSAGYWSPLGGACWTSGADHGALSGFESGGWSSWLTRNSSPMNSAATIAKKTTKLRITRWRVGP